MTPLQPGPTSSVCWVGMQVARGDFALLWYSGASGGEDPQENTYLKFGVLYAEVRSPCGVQRASG